MGNCLSATPDSRDTKDRAQLHESNNPVLATSANRQNPGTSQTFNKRATRFNLFPSHGKAGGRRLQDGSEHGRDDPSASPAEMARRAAEARRKEEMKAKELKTLLLQKYAERDSASRSGNSNLVLSQRLAKNPTAMVARLALPTQLIKNRCYI
ncbi:hypothetical protein LPJ74_002513 [Coemansia sp. RSA 1843]|nr:hypothetical protein LPJ74_002513 [Coemansia sp. RSA 1843]